MGERRDEEPRDALYSEIQEDIVGSREIGQQQMVSGTRLALETGLQFLGGSLSQSVIRATCCRITRSAY